MSAISEHFKEICDLFVHSSFLDDGDVYLMILDYKNNASFHGVINDDIKNEMFDLIKKDDDEKSKEEILDSWIKSTFQNGDNDSESMTFTLELDSFDLIWKRSTTNGKLKLKIGTIPLKLEDEDARNRFIRSSIETIQSLRKDARQKAEGFERLKDNLKESRAALKEFQKAKSEIETKLYEQFIPLLQSKQDHNKVLKKKLDKLSSDDSANNESMDVVEEENYDVDTDVDDDLNTSVSKECTNKSINDSQNFLNLN